MSPVWRQDDVDGAVVQREVIHEAQDFFFDLDRELVGSPALKHANTVASPVVSGPRGDLGVNGRRHHAVTHNRDTNLERLRKQLLNRGGAHAQAGEVRKVFEIHRVEE